MSTTIEEALATVKEPQGDSSRLRTDLENTRGLRDWMFGAEATARQELDAKITTIENDLNALTIAAKLGIEARILSPEVLRWRHSKKLRGIPVPKLAYVPITGNEVKITRAGWEPKVASVVNPYYADVMAELKRIHLSDNPFTRNLWASFPTLTYKFQGMIPAETRAKIHEALSSRMFDKSDVALIVETPRDTWEYADTKRSFRKELSDMLADPIVVAHAANRFWVIDVFDPTTLEQYIANEFAPKQLNAGS